MSPRLPRVTAAQVARALERRGFHVVRQSGSHRIYRNEAGVRITLPMHAGTILHPKIVSSIMEAAQLEPDDL